MRQLPPPNVRRMISFFSHRKSPRLAAKIAKAPRLTANLGGCHDHNRDSKFNNRCRKAQGEPPFSRGFAE